ncbi:glycoside hydrolase family 5 protein [Enterococcus sp. LJL98]
MSKKIKGVNLGGWLVLEKWMTPELFEGVQAEDEYYLAHDLSKEAYEARILTHRSEFITEADFIRIAESGLNLVRIPVPYFVFGDREPFVGCLSHLDKAFNWAKAYDIDILIDLHTVPESQNGFDNGGISGVCKWGQNRQEVEFVLSVLTRLAKRYHDHEALWGIQLVNEPITEKMWSTMKPLERYEARNPEMAQGSGPLTMTFLQDFYVEAYGKLREILRPETTIAFHDAFELHVWKEFFAKYAFENVMLDTHQYLMFAELAGTEQNVQAYLDYLDHLGKEIQEVSQYVRVFVGEWSLFNSYTVGADTQGGINPTQQTFESSSQLSKEELAKVYQTLWKKSIETWNLGEGHMFWTYKLNIDTINDPAWYGWDSWDLSRCLSKKWIEI